MDTTQLVTLLVAIVAALSSVIAAIVASRSGATVKRLEAQLARQVKLIDKFSDFVTESQTLLSTSLVTHYEFFDNVKYYRDAAINDESLTNEAVINDEMTGIVLPNGEPIETHLSSISLETLSNSLKAEQTQIKGFLYKRVIPASAFILNEIKFLWFYTKLGSNYAPIVRMLSNKERSPRFLIIDLFSQIIDDNKRLIAYELAILNSLPHDGMEFNFSKEQVNGHCRLLNRYVSSITSFNAYVSSKLHP
ncbi:hypothetical protein [Deinococcus aetherius]|uniref:hypothetical protein n=1 Tax=Deinococcus aetherius TaxID=200252 RepID=UPI00222FA16C|nr:hypothetical protein [Deinococcus aetherius]